jgi:hypothetical protein
MDKTAHDMLKGFADTCPCSTIREEHWEQLYHFTVYVHRQGLNTEDRTIRDYLVHRGCSRQKANWLIAQYRHFSKLLTIYDERKRDG